MVAQVDTMASLGDVNPPRASLHLVAPDCPTEAAIGSLEVCRIRKGTTGREREERARLADVLERLVLRAVGLRDLPLLINRDSREDRTGSVRVE